MLEKTFWKKLKETAEGIAYCNLIEEAKKENRGLERETGFEKHHIHPRKLGGLDKDPKNQVKLTVFEHCKAHALLAKAINKYSALRPILTLTNSQFQKLNKKEQEILLESFDWQNLYNLSCRLDQTEQAKQKNREKHLGKRKGYRWINNGKFQTTVSPEDLDSYLKAGYVLGALPRSEEARASMREKRKDFVPWNKGKKADEQIRTKISIRLKGNRNRLGTDTSPEARRRFSEAAKKRWEDPEYRKKYTESRKGKDMGKLTGKISIHKESLEMKVFPEQLESYLKEGWIRGGRTRKKYEKHSK